MGYTYFQPNHLDTKDEYGDCVIRALCNVFDKTWIETFNIIVPYEIKYQCPISCMPLKLYKEVMSESGFEYIGISNKKGTKRPTVKEFAKKNKDGVYILSLANHWSSVKDGSYYDTWDCGDKCLYGYFKLRS